MAGAAILVAAFSLGYVWIFLITIFFLLAEYLFVILGIYEQHWWKYYMSAIIVVAFLVIAKKWFVKLNHTRHGFVRAATFYFVALIIIHIPHPLLLLLWKQNNNVSLVNDIFRSSTLFVFVYHLIECFLLVLFVCVLKKWFWKLVPFVIAFVVQSTLAGINILVFHNGWRLLYTLMIYAICLGIFMLIEKFTLKADELSSV